MERNALEAKIIEIIAMTYNKEESGLSMNTDIREELGGASILMVGLVSEIENELEAMVPLQAAAACKTIGDLVDRVEELL